MIKSVIGLLIGLLIGVACRWFDVPVPSPPRFIGALLVVAMTVGYIGTDKLLAVKSGRTDSRAAAMATRVSVSAVSVNKPQRPE
jgi:XapX domain-containing protein